MRLSAFITADTIAKDLQDGDGVATAVERLRSYGVERVFIESRRGVLSTPGTQLEFLRDAFREAGFETAGGIMPLGETDMYDSPGLQENRSPFGKEAEGIESRGHFLCYSAAETGDVFEAEMRKMARLFDTIILDDAFLTPCRCAQCRAAKAADGESDWGRFRRALMSDFTRTRVAEPAREENPDVTLIIKFPQYYDRYADFGYDVVAQTEIFDGVWAGCETRDPNTLAYGYVPPYESQAHVAYLRAAAGDKLWGGWFDYLDCTPELFRDQVMLTTLTGLQEITIFRYTPELFAPDSAILRCLRDDRERIHALAESAQEPLTDESPRVVWYRPPNVEGGDDLALPDFLGMWALPVDVATIRPEHARTVVLSYHALSDPDPVQLVETLENAGVRILATIGFLQGLRDREDVLKRFGIHDLFQTRVPIEALQVDDTCIALSAPMTLPWDIEPMPDCYSILGRTAEVVERVFQTPLWLEADDTHALLNLRTFGREDYVIMETLNTPSVPDHLHLPDEVTSRIRHWCLAPFGLRIETPGWTCAVPLGGEALALVRPHDKAAGVRVAWGGQAQCTTAPGHDWVVVKRTESS